MKVVVKANGGLGNRMRVLASCVALSQRLRTEVEVLWVNNNELNCSFFDLFMPLAGIQIEEKKYIPTWNKIGLRLRKTFFNSYAKDFDIQIGDEQIRELSNLKSDVVKLIKDAKTVYIDTCEHFYGDTSFLAYLIPHPSIQDTIEDRLKTMCTSNYIGVHIRRGDNKRSKDRSPTVLFMKKLAEELGRDENKVFYLSTDDRGEAKIMINKFGSAIKYFPAGLKRNKPENIQSALLDLLILARSERIIGSYWSSFTDVAASYGGIHLEVVKSSSDSTTAEL